MESNEVCRLDTSTSSLTSSFINTANTDMPFLLKKKQKNPPLDLETKGAVVVVILW